MKHQHASHGHHQRSTHASSTAVDGLRPGSDNPFPSSDEVATKAYFNYVNQGSQDGHHEIHWLAAESELLAERTLGYARDSHL